MNKAKMMRILGIAFILSGLILLLTNIQTGGWFGGRSGKIGFIFVLITIDFVLMMIKPQKIFKILLIALILLLIIIAILNLRIYLASMSILKLLFMLGIIATGIALLFKSKHV